MYKGWIMKKLITLCLLLIGSYNSYAFDLPKDKQLHLEVSSMIGIGTYYTMHNSTNFERVTACTSVGIAKEIYDEYSYGGFSYNDIKYDIIGCVIGVYTTNALNVMINDDTITVSYKLKY